MRECFCAYEPTPAMCPEHGVVRGEVVFLTGDDARWDKTNEELEEEEETYGRQR